MLCARPFRTDSGEFGCGQCLPCRLNRKNTWVARIQMELASHPENTWATFTYAPEHLPALGSLCPRDMTLFLKRLRFAIGSFRYFYVGEYGDQTQRPHYHAFLFGLGVQAHASIEKAWGLGHVHFGADPSNSNAAQYTAGYTVKKWTKKDHEELGGRYREFARMSLKPPIGSPYVDCLANTITQDRHVVSQLWEQGDVPGVVRFNGKLLPMGRTMVRKLRVAIGKEPDLPEDVKVVRAQAFRLMEKSDTLRRDRERRRAAGIQKAQARQKIYRRKVL